MSDEFGELLELLHLAADDPITLCHQEPGGTFVPTRTTAADGPKVAARYTDTVICGSPSTRSGPPDPVAAPPRT